MGKLLLLVLAGGAYSWLTYRISARRLAKELDARSTLLSDPLLTHLIQRMAQALEVNNIRAYIYEVPNINGLAAPDGRIFLTRGFMEKYRLGDVKADELASVVAHELGHVALGHSRRREKIFLAQSAMRTLLIMLLGRFIPRVGGFVANILTNIFLKHLSRRDELEADAYAAALLIKSGIGTEPQKALLKKLGKLAGGANNLPAWIMSHPTSEKRIAAIEICEKRWNQK